MQKHIVGTAIAGIMAAVLVGIGEYLLHYDALARFTAGGYDFMSGISANRSTVGHFFGVFGAALYPIGCYHIYQMLRPASSRWAFIAFLVGTFGFMVGVVWIGSRASVSALVQLPESAEVIQLIELYDLRYETLLQIIRFTTLVLSGIIIWLALTGRSHYPRWMAAFNPIVLLIANFILFAVVPEIGKHTMPIALNVAFFIFFVLSLSFSFAAQKQERANR
ncbi:MAG: hypothetical protein ACI9UN_000838 [Granulosicoccus sp.]